MQLASFPRSRHQRPPQFVHTLCCYFSLFRQVELYSHVPVMRNVLDQLKVRNMIRIDQVGSWLYLVHRGVHCENIGLL